jgi:hypothetical protein
MVTLARRAAWILAPWLVLVAAPALAQIDLVGAVSYEIRGRSTIGAA